MSVERLTIEPGALGRIVDGASDGLRKNLLFAERYGSGPAVAHGFDPVTRRPTATRSQSPRRAACPAMK